MKRQITQMASDLQKLKASEMKMAMEIANRKVTAFVLHLSHHMIFSYIFVYTVQLKPWKTRQQPTTSTSTALLVECVPASTVPANSTPQGLQSVSEVMRASSKLCVPARASTLAVKLARDAIFGEEVMLQITLTCGRGGFKALPAEGTCG